MPQAARPPFRAAVDRQKCARHPQDQGSHTEGGPDPAPPGQPHHLQQSIPAPPQQQHDPQARGSIQQTSSPFPPAGKQAVQRLQPHQHHSAQATQGAHEHPFQHRLVRLRPDQAVLLQGNSHLGLPQRPPAPADGPPLRVKGLYRHRAGMLHPEAQGLPPLQPGCRPPETPPGTLTLRKAGRCSPPPRCHSGIQGRPPPSPGRPVQSSRSAERPQLPVPEP